MSDNAYDGGQVLAEMLHSTSSEREIETAKAVNVAAIAYELRTANLLAARHISRVSEDPKDRVILERLQ